MICPHCEGELEYGATLDTVTMSKGYYCSECDVTFSSFDLV